jgi:hypothetical protein
LRFHPDKKEALFGELSKVIQSDVKPGYESILQYMEKNYDQANNLMVFGLYQMVMPFMHLV